MSRKPPKLVPVEGKETAGPGNGKTPQGALPAKQGGNIGGSNATLNTPRRSSLTRHFLNCNGSAPVGTRRFPSKFSSAPTSALAPSTASSLASSTENNAASNGCADDKPHNSTPFVVNSAKKVNGTISNGLTSTKTNESSKLIKRSKSIGISADSSVNSDIPRGSASATVNGKKRESVNSHNNVSNSTGSQNNSTANVKRTGRFSQSSAIAPRPNKGPPTVPLSPTSTAEEKTMPALVACEPPSITNENPGQSEEPDKSSGSVGEPISEEPKIIRKGDTVIKSYVDEKTGKISVFERGMKLEVCDFGSGRWYPAKVMNIDRDKQEILVHYSNWSSRYDEWISMKSSRVRPGQNTNVVRLHFIIGERVKAVWPMDSRKYSGTVTQELSHDLYEVTFDDGIKLKRSAHQLFKVSQQEELEDEPPPVLTRLPESNKIDDVQPVRSPTVRRKSIKTMNPKPQPRTKGTLKLPTNETQEPPSPVPAQDINNESNANRPSHFSVFDPPQGELGKRKRTVHDYSALVKGRQRQREPQIRGPRRPKSEGSSMASSPTTSVVDEVNVSSMQDLTPKADTTNDSTETGSDTKRRQKSGTTNNTQVPASELPLNDTPKELPLVETMSTEQLSIPETNETPAKKRKQFASTLSSSTSNESKFPPKSEAAQVDTPPAQGPTTTTANRRTKSLSTLQLGILPPLVDPEIPNDTKADSGFVDELGNAIVIEQNAQDGFWKCPLDKCGKNFRKDSLLKMHFKHYHPELKVANARGIANVVQMAQARHAFDNDPSDYHHSWPKYLCTESVPVEKSEVASTTVVETNDVSPPEVADTPTPHKKAPKAIHQNLQVKHLSPEKVSPAVSHTVDETSSPTTTSKNSEDSSPPKASVRSPRLRVNRRRNFVLTKYGRIRTTNKPISSVHSRNDVTTDEGIIDSAMETESCKISTVAKTALEVTTGSDIAEESSVVPSPSNSCLSTSNTPSSPSVSDRFGTESCSGSSSGDPIFAPSNSELEPPIVSSSGRTFKGRWSKTHLRRGFIGSSIRRLGTSTIQNSTTLFLKKRMQYRKFMGKRGSRQKRISILSRISSGRMRVILDALNQRSLKRKRFRAARRYRDVKVDVINCVCSSKTEFGLMIQCELCLCWQHGSCFNVQSNSQLPDFYACQSCSEPEKVRLSRKYEWAESEFYRLGKLPSFPYAPSFSKEDARIMKMCTNLSSNLLEAYSMIKGLKVKERICFGQPDHPQLYEWNTERAPPQEEIQKDRFNKYFKPVLRRLLLENKSDPAYHSKLRKLAEARMKLRKYSDAVESARSTLKKKLGCRAAAFLNHICDRVLNDMVRTKRKAATEEPGDVRKEYFDSRKRYNAEQAYQRLRKVRDEVSKNYSGDLGAHDEKYSSFDDGASSSSQTSNGLRKEATLNVRDYCVLTRYLKEKRTIDDNIGLTLTRMSKEFPDDWKNLMKVSRVFIDESKEEAKLKWITSVIVTYNTLRILLKQIYSENNAQKQRNFCLDFERTTMKLFDLFGIGLPEERAESKKQHASTNQRKRIRGLETLDMLTQSTPTTPLKKSNPILPNDLDEARKEILKRLGSSTKPLSSKDVEDLLTTAAETKLLEEVVAFNIHNSTSSIGILHKNTETKPVNVGSATSESTETNYQSTDIFLRARKLDGQIPFEFNQDVHLLDAVKFACDIPEEECTEEGLSLEFLEAKSQEEPSSFTGIFPVPAKSRITPEVCRKNLVRDILLQQQQIDVYLDKIEAQIIKLSTQSRNGDTAIPSTKPAELSALRTRMLHSLELVSRLSKTGVGDDDIIEPDHSEDMDVSETTITDDSDLDGLSSESDGFDNASNYSGTDTETADEGDITGDDDLLDV